MTDGQRHVPYGVDEVAVHRQHDDRVHDVHAKGEPGQRLPAAHTCSIGQFVESETGA